MSVWNRIRAFFNNSAAEKPAVRTAPAAPVVEAPEPVKPKRDIYDFSDLNTLRMDSFPILECYQGQERLFLSNCIAKARTGGPDDVFALGKALLGLMTLHLAGTSLNGTTQKQAGFLFEIAAAAGHKDAAQLAQECRDRPPMEPPHVRMFILKKDKLEPYSPRNTP
ncbi:hypothetical protein [Micavibrio aeruginosavorus]|uniref:hypothetical protein n=1 Tax=Micavibrio aeruginosavorus TaxID=349221 RepID=UPI003F4AE174